MAEIQNNKKYDLERRTLQFAKDVRAFTRLLPKHTQNCEDVKQIVRSSGSIGANYIEANESLGKKDLALRIRIARKEAKETIYWLNLLDCTGHEGERDRLIDECTQLMRIFGAILGKIQ